MKQHLGLALQTARKASGLKQCELGAILGTDKQMISKIETGERRMLANELITFARIFGDTFEFATEAHMSEIIADLAAGLRQFLGTTQFAPEQIGKRDWLQQLLSELDATYVAEFA